MTEFIFPLFFQDNGRVHRLRRRKDEGVPEAKGWLLSIGDICLLRGLLSICRRQVRWPVRWVDDRSVWEYPGTVGAEVHWKCVWRFVWFQSERSYSYLALLCIASSVLFAFFSQKIQPLKALNIYSSAKLRIISGLHLCGNLFNIKK